MYIENYNNFIRLPNMKYPYIYTIYVIYYLIRIEVVVMEEASCSIPLF